MQDPRRVRGCEGIQAARGQRPYSSWRSIGSGRQWGGNCSSCCCAHREKHNRQAHREHASPSRSVSVPTPHSDGGNKRTRLTCSQL